ncbi:MAG: DNA helicase [uncultured Sulfurovum sp.]|uniref:DNA 3'-5' helicase n=1 Tax=uncultured Sulfurovum sp. TaxID=269237 RepID=A0A6S6SW89_9BACT|nr:MAG: DNA helicase [uncultured Sulfurovum sp.]
MLSSEQYAIVNTNVDKVATVLAYAGTGKSFTLKQLALSHPDKSIILFVFNKSMRIDAEKTFSDVPNVTITTFHGLAFRGYGKYYMDRLRKNETLRADQLLPYVATKHTEEHIIYMRAHTLLLLFKDFLASSFSINEYLDQKKYIQFIGNITCHKTIRLALSKLKLLWEDIITITNSLPFEHDIYLKMYQLKKHLLDYDWFFVDEAQDINPVMVDIVVSQLSGDRLVKAYFVGDEMQQIYSFRGAINSLAFIQNTFDAEVFYLSNSYRCPPHIAKLANKIILELDGKKEYTSVAPIKGESRQKTYIGRTSSGIVALLSQMLHAKVYFVGGVDGYNLNTLNDLVNLLGKKREYINDPYIKSFPDLNTLKNHSEEIDDIKMIGLIGIVFKYMSVNIFNLTAAIKSRATLDINTADIIVTTAHRSKGLEWEKVELLDDFPFNYDENLELEAEVEDEEKRLLYVAITRCKGDLSLPSNILKYLKEDPTKSQFRGSVEASTKLFKLSNEDTREKLLDDIDLALSFKEERKEEETSLKKKPKSRLTTNIKKQLLKNDSVIKNDYIGICVECGNDCVFIKNNYVGCDACDFKISFNKYESFLNHFKSKSGIDEIIRISKAICLNKKIVMRLEGKKGVFSAEVVFKKDEKFGWGLNISTFVNTSTTSRKLSGRKGSRKSY